MQTKFMTVINSGKPAVAIFVHDYLARSMVFIDRQVRGLSSQYDILVLCANDYNKELFPFSPLVAKNKTLAERIIGRLRRILFSKYIISSRSQFHAWKHAAVAHRIRLIHAHFGPDALEILPVAKSLKIPLLVTFHGYDASRLLRNRTYCRQLKHLFEYAEIIAVSELIQSRLVGLGADPKRVHLLHIGVPSNPKAIQRKPICEKIAAQQDVVFLQISSFVEKKGHYYTLSAFAELVKECNNCRLILAGDGPLRVKMEELAIALGISDRVSFPGWLMGDQAKWDLLERCDIFVHHSVTASDGDQEGIPTAILEAMQTGMPVITSRHAGIPELIIDGVNGYLVNERDIANYVMKMKQVISAPTAELISNAKSTIIDRFNLETQNQKLSHIYRRILDAEKC